MILIALKYLIPFAICAMNIQTHENKEGLWDKREDSAVQMSEKEPASQLWKYIGGLHKKITVKNSMIACSHLH